MTFEQQNNDNDDYTLMFLKLALENKLVYNQQQICQVAFQTGDNIHPFSEPKHKTSCKVSHQWIPM